MTSQTLLIDAIVTCCNQESFIGQAIESVLNQTRYDCMNSVIVVDDGSADRSLAVIRDIAKREPRIIVVGQHPSGTPSGARNCGIKRSKGHYVSFLDGDDVWLPHKLEVELDALDSCSGAGLYYSGFVEIGPEGRNRIVRPKRYTVNDQNALPRFFVEGAPVIPSTALVRRDVFESCGYFDESMSLGEDQEMWLRILRKFPFQLIDEITVQKRVLPKSLTFSAQSDLARLDNFEVISQRMYQSEPSLSCVARARARRISRGRVKALLRLGDLASARREARALIRLAGLDWRAWTYVFVGYMGWKMRA